MTTHRNGTIKFTKGKSHRAIAHTGSDKRYSEANQINNMNLCCRWCGTNIRASQSGNQLTIRCNTYTEIGILDNNTIGTDILCVFNDNHSQF
jgi:hypothetical protein